MKNSQRGLTFALIFLVAVSLCSVLGLASATDYQITLETADSHGSIRLRNPLDPLTLYGEGTYSFAGGTQVTITASPDTGYIFSYFSFSGDTGSGTTSVNPIQTTVLSTFTIIAHFVENTGTNYTVSLTDEYGGNTNINYNGLIYNSGSSPLTVEQGAQLTATAHPILGYKFQYFLLNETDYVTSSQIELTINGDSSIHAFYTVDFEGQNDAIQSFGLFYGALTSTDGDFYSGSGGNASFLYNSGGYGISITGPYGAGTYYLYTNSILTLTAYPEAGYNFKYWIVDSGTDHYSFRYEQELKYTLTSNVTFTAVFSNLSGGTDFTSLNWAELQTSTQALILLVVGCLMSFGALAIFIKSPGAWIVGIILFVAGLAAIMLAQPSIIGLICWAFTVIVSAVFLFVGQGKGGKNQK